MSDRYYALTVALEVTLKDEDAQGIIDAIRHLRGVADVQPLVANAETYWAQTTARQKLVRELWEVLDRKD